MIVITVVYVLLSVAIYGWMFRTLPKVSLGSKTQHTHPEMKQVKPGESLLTLKFHGPPSTSNSEQHPDLGFAKFLANRDSNFGDHGNS
jgi:hypothetical protein